LILAFSGVYRMLRLIVKNNQDDGKGNN